MRIRKHAARLLLGSASLPHHSPPRPPTPPPPPVGDQSAAVSDGPFLCQLNCSPWDVMDSNSFYFHQEGGGEEGTKGIMGNVFGLGDEEGILGISEAFTRSVAVGEPYLYCEDEDDSDQKKKKEVKKRRRRKKEKVENVDDDDVGDDDDEKTSSVVTVIAKSSGGVGQVSGICKKNDGKGWHCSRPANPHHTLCDHHLTQLKSYSRYNNSNSSSNNVAREEADADRGSSSVSDLARVVKKDQKMDGISQVKNSRRSKTKAAVAATSKSAGDGYYYYSGFGLQRGKTRNNGRKEELAVKNESESGDGSDAPIAGDDLDDDDDTDDNVDEDVKIVGNVDNNKGIIKRKKRGRKPIKARSLKSLL